MVASAWFFEKDEIVSGPMDRMTLMEHTFNGDVGPDTLVWSAWDDRRRPIHDLPEFAGFLSVSALQGTSAPLSSQPQPLLSRVASGSWVLLGGLSLVILMVVAVLMLRNEGTSAWRLPSLLVATLMSLALIREGHLSLQGRRRSLSRAGFTTAVIGLVALTLTGTLEALSGLGSFAFFAALLTLSGVAALVSNRDYKAWHIAQGG